MSSINVSHNGEPSKLAANTNLHHALELWGYTDEQGLQKVASAINGDFVPRSQYQQTLLNDGDEVDIVAPVGGG